ncbi:type I-B CRISPR-associated endonuclease Cas1b [uncultured Sanguibacteroides sp.]|uniref:type I-B CRISPR-associated endonuclease Cas1b n=1 Tax=uncultured Sanguibacteroides sp. TaxID=1635151 RepID=UPI0025DDD1F7|nr:type I-B CRISPR-associated endonuclease Cas1b [uncultured Sanguibacteroides sp.]
MKRTYYLFNPGRLSRKDNTLKFTPVDEEGREGQPRYIPVETVDNLFVFGSLDANSAMYNFLGKNQIAVHFFDYYEHYTGSFMPKDYLLSGRMQIAQMKHYIRKDKRMAIARRFIQGAAFNMLKNLKYYNNRDKDTLSQINRIENYIPLIETATEIPELMGIEGNIRQTYYEAFDVIIDGFVMGNRSKMPPSNEVNAMISFANSMCYSVCLDAIYHTQLNPTISFLHEPGERRYSLALDLAEIFKPILADRLIFSMLNRKQIQKSDFDQKLNGCLLKPSSMKKVSQEWENKVKETIKHKMLGRHVSYKHLIKLECYKLTKHLLDIEEYKPLKMWW